VLLDEIATEAVQGTNVENGHRLRTCFEELGADVADYLRRRTTTEDSGPAASTASL
jgi:hypothetical protein